MAMKVDVLRGIKIDVPPEAESSQMPILTMLSAPPEEEVEGQFFYSGWTQCPGCQQVGWTTGLNSQAVNTIMCAACGSYFKVFPTASHASG